MGESLCPWTSAYIWANVIQQFVEDPAANHFGRVKYYASFVHDILDVFSSSPSSSSRFDSQDIDTDVYPILHQHISYLRVKQLSISSDDTPSIFHVLISQHLRVVSIYRTVDTESDFGRRYSTDMVNYICSHSPQISKFEISGDVTVHDLECIGTLRCLEALFVHLPDIHHPLFKIDQPSVLRTLSSVLHSLPNLHTLFLHVEVTNRDLSQYREVFRWITCLHIRGAPSAISEALAVASKLRDVHIHPGPVSSNVAWQKCFDALTHSSANTLQSVKIVFGGTILFAGCIEPLLTIRSLRSFEIMSETSSLLSLEDCIVQRMVSSWPGLQRLIFPPYTSEYYLRPKPQSLFYLAKLADLHTLCMAVNHDMVQFPLTPETLGSLKDCEVRRIVETLW